MRDRKTDNTDLGRITRETGKRGKAWLSCAFGSGRDGFLPSIIPFTEMPAVWLYKLFRNKMICCVVPVYRHQESSHSDDRLLFWSFRAITSLWILILPRQSDNIRHCFGDKNVLVAQRLKGFTFQPLFFCCRTPKQGTPASISGSLRTERDLVPVYLHWQGYWSGIRKNRIPENMLYCGFPKAAVYFW